MRISSLRIFIVNEKIEKKRFFSSDFDHYHDHCHDDYNLGHSISAFTTFQCICSSKLSSMRSPALPSLGVSVTIQPSFLSIRP